jgi:hypothetical protein
MTFDEDKHAMLLCHLSAGAARFRLYGVLSGAASEASIQGEALELYQRVLSSEAEGLISSEDAKGIREDARIINGFAKRNCTFGCNATGAIMKDGQWTMCVCALRAIERDMAERSKPIVPGRQEVLPEETVKKEVKRLDEARATLERAEAAQQRACASIDAEIAILQEDNASYFQELKSLNEMHDAFLRASGEIGVKVYESGTAWDLQKSAAERMSEELGAVLIGFVDESAKRVDYEAGRTEAMAKVEAVFQIVQERDRHRAEWAKHMAARAANSDERVKVQIRIEELNTQYASVPKKLEELRVLRERVARRYESKIESAKRRVQRLAYITGDVAALEAAP